MREGGGEGGDMDISKAMYNLPTGFLQTVQNVINREDPAVPFPGGGETEDDHIEPAA